VTTRSEAREAADGPAPTQPSSDFIVAKLLVPSGTEASIPRRRNLRRLRAEPDRRFVSIVAPPGYGKTTLLAQWATNGPREAAWLTIDDLDNDPGVFLGYLAAALHRIEPLGPSVFRAVHARSVSARSVIGRLLSAIVARPRPVLLALDDAHRLTDRASLDALAELVTYLPPGSQVAVASREPVDLPLARWRAQGSTLLEFGPTELALDAREADALARRHGPGLPDHVIERLTRRTEGWPALLALATRAAREPAHVDEDFLPQGSPAVTAYLRAELLDRRSEAEVAFLTRTSILERLNGPLCDAVTGGRGSAAHLADLARSTLLVDEYGGWFRYHLLLREFLAAELRGREPEHVAELHRRAAAWYAEAGEIDLAAHQAFSAGDLDLAASFVGGMMLANHWSGRRALTQAWLSRYSDPALEERPWLAVLAAWECMGTGDASRTLRFADIAERGSFAGRPPDGTASFESSRSMLRATVARHGAESMLRDARRAVELEPETSPWRDFALWMLSFALLTNGEPEAGDQAIADALTAARGAGHDPLTYCILGHRAQRAAERGDWTSAVSLMVDAQHLGVSALVEGFLASIPAVIAHIRILVHQGDAEAARRELARAVSLRPAMGIDGPAVSVIFLLGLARAHLAVGDPAGARTLLRQAEDIIRMRPDLGILPAQVADLRTAIALLPAVLGGASTLTAAELRVLAMLPYYLSFKEIGQRLGVKGTTVKTHALSIYGKLGASSRSEAVELAVEAGLLDAFPATGPASPVVEDAADAGW
jgi:LuxR family transcriptional regulator, maltose regulon positive regulatory protein